MTPASSSRAPVFGTTDPDEGLAPLADALRDYEIARALADHKHPDNKTARHIADHKFIAVKNALAALDANRRHAPQGRTAAGR